MAVREYKEPLIALPPGMEREFRALQDFLHHAVYEHPAVRTMVNKGQAVLRALFLKFSEAPELLPRTTQARLAAGEDPPARVIGDYLAGMTDRHATLVYRKIFDPETPVGIGFGD